MRRMNDRTVYVVENIFCSPPIVQRREKGGQRQAGINEIDNAELVVNVEGAAFILQDEALLRRGEGEAGDCNQ